MTTASLYPAIRPTLDLNFAATETLDPRVTFSRASTGAYYDGKTVVKAEENLVQYSQEFDNAFWTKNESTVTANNQTAPDGTSTAETMTENTSNSLHRVFVQITSTAITYTASCFFKAGTRSWAYIRMIDSGGVGRNAFFNLSSGVLGTVDSGMSATITSVGNGWYRCSTVLTAAIAGTNAISLGMSSADNTISYTGDGTSTLLLWGAQLEQRATLTAYTPTTTAPITNYIPVLQTAASNVARFDHDPVTGESKGLLIEEQRTNLLTYSDQFDNAAWTKIRASITPNTIVAPDGTLTGDKIVEDTTATSTHQTSQSTTKAASVITYTVSLYIKAAERSRAFVGLSDFAGSDSYAIFNLATGTVGAATNNGAFTGGIGNITPVGNGWYKCAFSATSSTVTTIALLLRVVDNSNNFVYTGDGYSGIYIWGAQLEAGSFPTSYIPTVASQVTRSADSASMTGTNFSSWYRADEGTLYAEALQTPSENYPFTYRHLAACSDSLNNFVGLLVDYQKGLSWQVSVNTVNQAYISSSTNSTGLARIAGAYKSNDFSVSGNGASAATDTSGAVPIGIDRLSIGRAAGNQADSYINGTIKRIAYFPKRLSNTELQGLTS